MISQESTSFQPLFLISALAFVIPILTSWILEKTKIQIPVVVGEIICGILIGKSCLGIIGNTQTIPWLDFLYLFGFTYLMFLSGLEVDINAILSKENKPMTAKKPTAPSLLKLGFWYFILTLILAFGISFILKANGYIKSLIMMTLILSTTSVGVVVPILKEKVLLKTDYGQAILIGSLIADFLTMLLITIFVALSASTKSTLNLLFIFILSALALLAYKLHISKTFDKIMNIFSFIRKFFENLSHPNSQLKVRGAIALMVMLIAASQAMGFEVILGAFLAGILTTLILGEEKTEKLEMKLDAIGYGFFIPIFFICVGINLNLKVFFAMPNSWLLLGLLILAAFLIKIIPSLIFTMRFSLKKSLNAGILLSSRLSLIIAASTIGLKEGFISEEINAIIIMVAVVSCIFAPIFFNKLLSKQESSQI